MSERKVTEEFSSLPGHTFDAADAGFSGKAQSFADWYANGRELVEGEELEMVLPDRSVRYRYTNGAFLPVKED